MATSLRCIVRLGVAAAIMSTLVACGGPKYSYKEESFDKKGPFEKHYAANADIAFAAMKKVLLRQGYTMEKQEAKERAFVASKQFQRDDINALLTISGIASNDGNRGADIWMAAQEVQYKVNEQKHTSSITAFFISIPVPTGSTKTLSKDRGETIQDKEFYDKLFAAIEQELPNVRTELEASRTEDDLRMRDEIERRLRAEMEIKFKLEREAKAAAAAQAKIDDDARAAAAAKLRREEEARIAAEIRAQLEQEARSSAVTTAGTEQVALPEATPATAAVQQPQAAPPN